MLVLHQAVDDRKKVWECQHSNLLTSVLNFDCPVTLGQVSPSDHPYHDNYSGLRERPRNQHRKAINFQGSEYGVQPELCDQGNLTLCPLKCVRANSRQGNARI